MAGKILILRWAGSAYDSLGGFLELIAQEFAAQGHSVTLFAADGEGWPNRLVDLLKAGDIAFALTMSGIATDLAVSDKLVWEAAKVPLFNWSCDHPSYFPSRHVIRNPFLLHGYVFPDHARYNITHLRPNGAAFAVHLGIPPRSLFPQAPLPLGNRNGRIMFTKTGHDTNEIEATWHTYIPDLQAIIFAAAEELFHRSTADALPVLRGLAEQRGIFLDGDSRLAMLLIREIDTYIRFRRANLVMHTVLRYPVDVFGNGWDHIKSEGAQARFHGAATWRAMIEQLPRYLGCLSTNPLVDDSVHDRSFFALAAGVVPVSDSNAFSRARMSALEPYTFPFTQERIEHAVEALLAAPAEALARTESTWQELAVPFGMRRAARQIVHFVALHGMNARWTA
ncbi:MAG: hypothetical protein ABSC06_31190 [Rhodopila sp.]|jgi:hypothetical protein